MEKITEDDLKKIVQYGGNPTDNKKHDELTAVYRKLEQIGDLLKSKGFDYSIRKDPQKTKWSWKFCF